MKSQRHRIAGLILLATLSVGAGCSTPGPTFEGWDGKVYVGDPAKQAIVRRQAGEEIRCSEPKFGQFVCLSAIDFETMYAIFAISEGCK